MTSSQIPYATEQGIFFAEQGIFSTEQGIQSMDRGIMDRKRRFLAHLFRSLPDAICSPLNFADEENEMADEILTRARYGETFWRARHEAWCRSELNQREYCEAQGIPLKAFGHWRAKFKAAPQPPPRKLLYRRGGLSHTLSHGLSHSVSHMTYGSPEAGPIVPPARQGHRRRFAGPFVWGKARTRWLDHCPSRRPGLRGRPIRRRAYSTAL